MPVADNWEVKPLIRQSCFFAFIAAGGLEFFQRYLLLRLAINGSDRQ
jgi:hypothetical protein